MGPCYLSMNFLGLWDNINMSQNVTQCHKLGCIPRYVLRNGTLQVTSPCSVRATEDSCKRTMCGLDFVGVLTQCLLDQESGNEK